METVVGTEPYRHRLLGDKLVSVGTTFSEINSSYELLSALQERGYDVIVANDYGDIPLRIQCCTHT